MQRCLKNKTGQTPSLALIVAEQMGKPIITPVWFPHPRSSLLAFDGSVWVEGELPGQVAVCRVRSQEYALVPVRILVTRHGSYFHLLKESGGSTGSSSYLGWGKGCWEAGRIAAVEAGTRVAWGKERSESLSSKECHHFLRLKVLPLAPMGKLQSVHWIPLPRSHRHPGFLCSRFGWLLPQERITHHLSGPRSRKVLSQNRLGGMREKNCGENDSRVIFTTTPMLMWQ